MSVERERIVIHGWTGVALPLTLASAHTHADLLPVHRCWYRLITAVAAQLGNAECRLLGDGVSPVLFVCLLACLGFNGTFSTNRPYRAITVG